MQYRTLGSTGLTVSQLCFGTSRFARPADGSVQTTYDEAIQLLDRCWELGINFFDTANVYGEPAGTAERWIGEWLEQHDREDLVIASKVCNTAVSRFSRTLDRKTIRAEIKGSLDRLGTEYLDIYYIHAWDDDTPIRETLGTLHDLVDNGVVHYLGASNLAAWQLTKGLWRSDADGLERFEIVQPRYNAAYRKTARELLEVSAGHDLAVCPYAGLEGGFLTGKYERNEEPPAGSRWDAYGWENRFDDRQWRVLDAVRDVAGTKSSTPGQVALRWLMDRHQFSCVPIVAARTNAQLVENANAVEIELTDEERARISAAYEET